MNALTAPQNYGGPIVAEDNAMNDGKMTQPLMLSGCKVLDFTQYLAGPTVTRLMAEMGADIIKIEQAPMGDPSRLLPIVKSGRSAYFVQQNRGKKSLCLHFDKPETNEILRSLVAKVDIVVENFGPGVMQMAQGAPFCIVPLGGAAPTVAAGGAAGGGLPIHM